MKLKKGDKVAVINSSIGGEYFVEFRDAVIVRQLSNSDPSYRVEVDGEQYNRFIDMDAQKDPDKYVSELNANRFVG